MEKEEGAEERKGRKEKGEEEGKKREEEGERQESKLAKRKLRRREKRREKKNEVGKGRGAEGKEGKEYILEKSENVKKNEAKPTYTHTDPPPTHTQTSLPLLLLALILTTAALFFVISDVNSKLNGSVIPKRDLEREEGGVEKGREEGERKEAVWVRKGRGEVKGKVFMDEGCFGSDSYKFTDTAVSYVRR